MPAAAAAVAGAARSRTNLTARAAVLAVAVCAVVLSLAYPFRAYVAQRAEIDRLRAQTAEQEDRVATLEAQRERWNDPAYVKAQARERLHFVMPGETAYVVLGQDDEVTPEQQADAVNERAELDNAWFTRLWSTVETAGER